MRLPDERPLPRADQMLADIIATPGDAGSPLRPRWLVAVAAGVLGIALGGGGMFWFLSTTGSHPGPAGQVTATPSPGTVPTATTGPTAAPGPATLQVGQTATFDHFEVTVENFHQDGDTFSYGLRTCVRAVPPAPASQDGRVAVGLGPWTARTTGWRTVVESSLVTDKTDYPVSDTFTPGQCAEGTVTATVRDPNTDVVALEYENSVGDRAVWTVR